MASILFVTLPSVDKKLFCVYKVSSKSSFYRALIYLDT